MCVCEDTQKFLKRESEGVSESKSVCVSESVCESLSPENESGERSVDETQKESGYMCDGSESKSERVCANEKGERVSVCDCVPEEAEYISSKEEAGSDSVCERDCPNKNKCVNEITTLDEVKIGV